MPWHSKLSRLPRATSAVRRCFTRCHSGNVSRVRASPPPPDSRAASSRCAHYASARPFRASENLVDVAINFLALRPTNLKRLSRSLTSAAVFREGISAAPRRTSRNFFRRAETRRLHFPDFARNFRDTSSSLCVRERRAPERSSRRHVAFRSLPRSVSSAADPTANARRWKRKRDDAGDV